MLRAIYMWINNCYPRLSYCWYIPGFDVENCLPMSVDIANDMRYTADQLTWGYDTTDVACIVGISTSQVCGIYADHWLDSHIFIDVYISH